MEIKKFKEVEEKFLKNLFKIDLTGELEIEYTFECDGTTVKFKTHKDVDLECTNREGQVLFLLRNSNSLKLTETDHKLCKAYDRMF